MPLLDPGRARAASSERPLTCLRMCSPHQSRGQAGQADPVDEGLAAESVERRRVDAPADFQQFVSRVEDRLTGLAHMSGCSAWSGSARSPSGLLPVTPNRGRHETPRTRTRLQASSRTGANPRNRIRAGRAEPSSIRGLGRLHE
jgi:hypothetical protein